MTTVTAVSKSFKQPYGGFLKPKEFKREIFDDGKQLNKAERISPGLIGLAVEYLTKVECGYETKDIFRISLIGAGFAGQLKKAEELLRRIKNSLDSDSIAAACQLAAFDTIYRAGPHTYIPISSKDISDETIENVKILAQRAVQFFNDNGPILNIGTTFEGGYSEKITKGDCDLLTEDGLWDMKVSKHPLNSKQTLQLLIYFVMGLRSVHRSQFEDLNRLGIFNPRMNEARYFYISDISEETIKTIEKNVIGYS